MDRFDSKKRDRKETERERERDKEREIPCSNFYMRERKREISHV